MIRSTALALAALLALASPALADPPTAAAFGRLPAVQRVAISPDGARIAILGGDAASRFISVAPVDGQNAPTLPLNDVQVRDLRWVGSNFVLARVAEFLSVPGNGGHYDYTFERDVTLNSDARPVARLLGSGDVSNFAVYLPVLGVDPGASVAYVQGLDWRSGDANRANSRLGSAQDTLVPTVWRVDVASGRGEIVERATPQTASVVVDLSGQPRVRLDVNATTGTEILLARAKGASSWRELARTNAQDLGFLGYSDPDDSVWFRRTGADGNTQIVRRALANDAETVVSTRPWVDASLVWDRDRMTPVAIVGGGARPEYEWLDAGLGAVQSQLDRAFRGKIVELESWNADRTRVVARVDGRDTPPAWFLYDTARREASALGEEYPELAGQAMGTTRWLTYAARDGQQIHAYVTLPPGAAAGGRAPLVVLPHGGPAARDEAGFDWWAQYLATRGYVVLQPQFRGSSGFGAAFERAGEREWAGKIQTDLLDGVAALASDNTIDPARICIVGASFGGYAALAGVALHPEAYRCAVSVAGVSDLPTMLGSTQRLDGERSQALRYWRRIMGGSDQATLQAASPARRASAITAPVLLIHGEHDTTVPIDQSQTMQRALASIGRPARLVTLPGDDHYLSTSATRTRMLEEVGAFLATNLPVAAPTIAPTTAPAAATPSAQP